MIIEAETAREGFEMAVEELKKVHQETGVNNAVIKISGRKLSKEESLMSLISCQEKI